MRMGRRAFALSLLLAAFPLQVHGAAEVLSKDGEAARPEKVLVLEQVVMGEVDERLAARLHELFLMELESAGLRRLPDEELSALREGARRVEPPCLEEARRLLEAGKEHCLNFRFEEGREALTRAEDAFLDALPDTGEPDLLIETLAYKGACAMDHDDDEGYREAFSKLLTLSPDHRLDERLHAPNVIHAFEDVRHQVRSVPRVSFTVTSAPPLATVTLNGVRRGETPITLTGLLPGRHALRVEAAGHDPWSGVVEVGPDGGTKEIHLDQARAGDDLRALEREASGEGERALMARLGGSLAKGASVDAVVLTALKPISAGYVYSVALVDTEGRSNVAWSVIDEHFLRAPMTVEALAESLLESAGPAYVAAPVPEPKDEVDFEDRLLGLLPPLVDDPARVARRGFFARTWWLWAGALMLGAGAAGAYVYGIGETEVEEPWRVGVSIEVER